MIAPLDRPSVQARQSGTSVSTPSLACWAADGGEEKRREEGFAASVCAVPPFHRGWRRNFRLLSLGDGSCFSGWKHYRRRTGCEGKAQSSSWRRARGLSFEVTSDKSRATLLGKRFVRENLIIIKLKIAEFIRRNHKKNTQKYWIKIVGFGSD